LILCFRAAPILKNVQGEMQLVIVFL